MCAPTPPLQVPNLFPKDELVSIMEAVTAKAKRAGKALTPQSLYAFFVEQVRSLAPAQQQAPSVV